MTTSVNEIAKRLFEKRFIHYQNVLDALVTAYTEFEAGSEVGANVILWGRGGFGKSEMGKAFGEAIQEHAFIQSFGASSSEEAIWGELDLQELRDGDAIRFHLERSFLNHKYVVFEEALDLPGRILDDLKDTLEARCFRRGVVQFPMKTRTIVICTNHDPQEFAKRNSSANALITRFPLEVKVEWPDYEPQSYRLMYQRQLPLYADLAPLFSMIASGLSDSGSILSPREALNMMRTVLRRAFSQGRESVVASDFKILVNATRFGRQKELLESLIRSALDSCGSHVKLNGYRFQAMRIIEKLNAVAKDGLERFVLLTSDLEKIRAQVHELAIPAGDGGFESKQQLLSSISQALRERE